MKKRLRMLVALGLAFSLCLCSCGGGGSSESGASGGSGGTQSEGGATSGTTKDTLTVAVKADPKNLNPFESSNNGNQVTKSAMLEKLFILDENNEVQPQLAESWEFNEDNTLLTVKLKEGILFHNGEELKASDVVFSYQMAQDEAIINAQIDYIDFANIRAVDDYTVEIPMLYPCAMAEQSIAGSYLFILNEKAVTEAGDDWIYDTPGTGPFRFVSYNAATDMTFERFEDYWGEKPAYKTLFIRVIGETSQALIELENGNVDMIVAPTLTDVKNITDGAVEDAVVEEYGAVTNWTLNFNMSRDGVSDKRVRQAIRYAMNLDTMVQGAYYGLGTPAASFAPSSVWGVNQDYAENPVYTQNQDKARELLAEAGYADGFTFNVYLNSSFPEQQQMLEIMQSQLAEVGITMQINVIENSALKEIQAAGVEDDAFMYGWTSTTGEIDNALYNRVHTSTAPTAGLFGWDQQEGSARVSELLDAARSEFDDEARQQMYYEVQQILMDEVPAIPLSERTIFVIQSENMEGLRLNGEFVWVDGVTFK